MRVPDLETMIAKCEKPNYRREYTRLLSVLDSFGYVDDKILATQLQTLCDDDMLYGEIMGHYILEKYWRTRDPYTHGIGLGTFLSMAAVKASIEYLRAMCDESP